MNINDSLKIKNIYIKRTPDLVRVCLCLIGSSLLVVASVSQSLNIKGREFRRKERNMMRKKIINWLVK